MAPAPDSESTARPTTVTSPDSHWTILARSWCTPLQRIRYRPVPRVETDLPVSMLIAGMLTQPSSGRLLLDSTVIVAEKFPVTVRTATLLPLTFRACPSPAALARSCSTTSSVRCDVCMGPRNWSTCSAGGKR